MDIVQRMLDEISTNSDLNFQGNPTHAMRWVISRTAELATQAEEETPVISTADLRRACYDAGYSAIHEKAKELGLSPYQAHNLADGMLSLDESW